MLEQLAEPAQNSQQRRRKSLPLEIVEIEFPLDAGVDESCKRDDKSNQSN